MVTFRRLIALSIAVHSAAAALRADSKEIYTFNSPAGRYRITTDVDKSAARDVAAHMDRVFAEYDRRMAAFHTRDTRPMPLYVFQTYDRYLKFLKGKDINGTNSAGMFFSNETESGLATFVSGQNQASMNRILQHEGFHQFAGIRIGAMPPWANEGLAEYFGQAIFARGKWLSGLVGEGRLAAVQKAIKDKTTFSMEELINMPPDDWNARVRIADPRTGLMYNQSWSVVHFLINANNGKYADAFVEYLQRLSKNDRPRDAYEKAFGRDSYDAMQRAWEKYTNDLKPDALSTAVRRLTFLGAGMRRLSEKGMTFASMDDVKREFRSAKFTLRLFDHGQLLEMSSDDDALFEPPDSGNTRKPASIQLAPDKGGKLPPEISIKGLKLPLRLVWTKTPDGELRDEIEYQ